MQAWMEADLRSQARNFRDRGGFRLPHNRRSIGVTMKTIRHRLQRRRARMSLRTIVQ